MLIKKFGSDSLVLLVIGFINVAVPVDHRRRNSLGAAYRSNPARINFLASA